MPPPLERAFLPRKSQVQPAGCVARQIPRHERTTDGNPSIPAGVRAFGPRSARPRDRLPDGLARERLCEVSFRRPTGADARMSDSGESSCRPDARRDNRTPDSRDFALVMAAACHRSRTGPRSPVAERPQGTAAADAAVERCSKRYGNRCPGTFRPSMDRPASGPDSEHVAEYPGASAPLVLLLLHDFPDPGRSHRNPCSSPSDTLNPHELPFPGMTDRDPR